MKGTFMPETDELLEQIAKLLMSAQRKAMRSQRRTSESDS
jgi:hypothetical protein